MQKEQKHRLAIFASGNGSNAQKIMEHFNDDKTVDIALVLSNKATAGVLQKATNMQVPTFIFNRATWQEGTEVEAALDKYEIDFVVLAGFLWLIPGWLIHKYPKKIVNIHPALLPKFGGKGMYGSHIHQAVLNAGEKESGITIHYVDEAYDTGAPIFQTSFEITEKDTLESLEKKIHALEHEYFPKVIENLLRESAKKF